MRYVIRPLEDTDLDGITRVHWRACRIAYRFMNWSYSEAQVRYWYAGKMGEWDWARAALADGSLVALIACIGPHVDQIYIDPDHQRAGLGTRLLRLALDRGLWPTTLNVFAENGPARALYERFGFREVDSWWNTQDGATELRYRLDGPDG